MGISSSITCFRSEHSASLTRICGPRSSRPKQGPTYLWIIEPCMEKLNGRTQRAVEVKNNHEIHTGFYAYAEACAASLALCRVDGHSEAQCTDENQLNLPESPKRAISGYTAGALGRQPGHPSEDEKDGNGYTANCIILGRRNEA